MVQEHDWCIVRNISKQLCQGFSRLSSHSIRTYIFTPNQIKTVANKDCLVTQYLNTMTCQIRNRSLYASNIFMISCNSKKSQRWLYVHECVSYIPLNHRTDVFIHNIARKDNDIWLYGIDSFLQFIESNFAHESTHMNVAGDYHANVLIIAQRFFRYSNIYGSRHGKKDTYRATKCNQKYQNEDTDSKCKLPFSVKQEPR